MNCNHLVLISPIILCSCSSLRQALRLCPIFLDVLLLPLLRREVSSPVVLTSIMQKFVKSKIFLYFIDLLLQLQFGYLSNFEITIIVKIQ